MRRFALMLVLAMKHVVAAVRPRRAGEMPGLEELLDRARVPRSVPPELLEFAKLADLRMDNDEDDDEDEDDEDDDDSDDDDDSEDDEESDDDDSEEDEDDEDSDDEKVDEDELDPKVKAILRKERKARREAEKKAKKAERGARRRQRGRREGGTKTKSGKRERRDRDDEERDDEPDPGTAKLQRANLISALQEAGYTGKRAKTVARLLDDVEYDDDEPVDLKDRIEEAEEAYGKEAVRKSSRSKPGGTDDGGGGGDGERPSLTAEELEAAKGMGMTPKEYAEFKKPQPKIPPKKDK